MLKYIIWFYKAIEMFFFRLTSLLKFKKMCNHVFVRLLNIFDHSDFL